MRLILTGATGVVGSAALNHILNLPAGEISALYILSRSPVPMAENKPNITVIQHKNFNEYPPDLLEKLKGADGCIWAQGISQTLVSKEDYVKITLDYPLAAAEAFSSLSDSFNFVYVSGEGATQSPNFLTPLFGRVKGQTETALLELSKKYLSLKPYNVRPAYVDTANDPETRKIQSQRPDQQSLKMRSLHTIFGPVMRNVFPKSDSPTQFLGKFLTDLAKGDGKPLSGEGVQGAGRIIPNVVFRGLSGL
ncbi:putative nucleoside-diphosphate-sugar epimerases [Aspergillus undulatus]|uniref:putative nucleoside-diphosphate-sugar epimerases n=1 Tax=Aspergillus undulatus TaxID=1810928 RepID=UPI003CCE36BD